MRHTQNPLLEKFRKYAILYPMRRQNETKLKWLLDAVLPGRLVDTPTLERHGITRMLAHKYIDSGWLEPVVRGLYRRPETASNSAEWQLVVRSLQHVMEYSSVVGGRTALELQGFAHYVPMGGDQDVHLYGGAHPTWLKRLDDAALYRLHSTKLFDTSADEETTEVDSPVGPLKCSTPERAILELVDELPKHESVHIVDTIFEGLASARPRRLEKLLASCTSIKVKRLFFVFADKHGHAWRRHLSPERFDLGSGPRALFENGHFHPRYAISVPPELIPQSEARHGA
ncbi:MAG: type IV toxin-antitoxin system AbiEi family antitoxin domain-containing protein [Henriciella sp.]